MPKNTVYVGRPSYFGNPYVVGKLSKDARYAVSKEQAKAFFRAWLYRAGTIKKDGIYGAGAEYRGRVMTELVGKTLACWCRLDEPCHADVLYELANGVSAE